MVAEFKNSENLSNNERRFDKQLALTHLEALGYKSGDNIYMRAFFPFAVNTKGQNKDWDFKKLAGGFVDVTGDIYDVQRHVAEGHALCAGLLGGQWRSKSNVVGSNWVLIDVDNSAVLPKALKAAISLLDASR